MSVGSSDASSTPPDGGVRVRLERWYYILPLRLRSLLRRATVDRELDEELRFHVDRQAETLIAGGMNADAARAAALRAIGSVDLRKDQCRDTRRTSGLAHLVTHTAADLRLALRLLRRSPALVGLAALSLALGIGANASLFSAIDALMLRPLPIASPDTLLAASAGDGWAHLPYSQMLRLRDALKPIATLAGSVQTRRSSIVIAPNRTPEGDPVEISLVSGNYFPLLGLKPAIGRLLTPAEDRAPGAHPVAVISHDWWLRHFGGSMDVLGRTVTLHATTYTIIGVGPRGFMGDTVGSPVDLWLPFAMADAVMPERRGSLLSTDLRSNTFLVRLLARAHVPGAAGGDAASDSGAAGRSVGSGGADGGGDAQAVSAAATRVYHELLKERAALAGKTSELSRLLRPLAFEPAPRGFAPRRLAPLLLTLTMVTGVVLLVACANVAGLLLARSEARRREIAIRLALGASTGRVARQLLTEHLLLAALGGLLGLAAAWQGTTLLARLLAAGTDPLRLDLTLDARALGFTLLLSIATGLLFGLTPALRGTRAAILPGLLGLESLTQVRTGGRRLLPLGHTIIVFQIALSLVLLVGAGLFARSLRNLTMQDLGYERSRTVLVWVAPGREGRDATEAAASLQTLRTRLAALPGVLSASASATGLLDSDPYWVEDSAQLNVAGRPRKAGQRWIASRVDARFFDTVGMPLLRGRDLTDRDVLGRAPVAVINETLARVLFDGENPIGQQLSFAAQEGALEVVGVVRDAKYMSPRESSIGMIYQPLRRDVAPRELCIALRAAGDPAALTPLVQRTLLEVDPHLPVLSIGTIDDRLRTLISHDRALAALSTGFAGLALLLAGVGIYGAIALAVARRLPEMGIRLALGATRARLLRLILGDSLRLGLIGAALGLPLALAASRTIASRLFGVTPSDPTTLAGAAVILLGVAMLAALRPALRATQVSVTTTLRRD